MGISFNKVYIHLVFSTKKREPLIKPEFEEQLKAYITGVAKQHEIRLLAINGTEDHLHILLMMPANISLSKAVQFIKGGSSRWLNKHFFDDQKFRWQRGYGAFTVNESLVPATIRYIQKQKQHHTKISYLDEFTTILNKHNIEYNEHSL